jgi:hypothetical protein
LGLAVAVACATKDYKFVPDPKAEHCSNGITDEGAGETDVDCGGDCQACELGQGCKEQEDCREGQCLDGFCQAPGCDNGAHDDGETGVDCGGMCKGCEAGDPCEGSGDCESMVCTDGICVAPTCDDGIINGSEKGRDCGGGLCDGCGTGAPCTEPTDCKSGVCAGEVGTQKCEVSCVEGTAECDGNTDTLEDECETNLLTDPQHCGACETVCELAHAEQSCVSGTCQIGSCVEPYEDCYNSEEDGCETNLRTSATDCGGCGMECSDQNGTPSCRNSECEIECDDGFLDCNNDRRDGCETSAEDVDNCGECENVCPSPPGEQPFCVDGECGSTPCPDGFGNCDGMGQSCEKDLTSDVMNCGRCRRLCTVNNGMPSCDDGACGVQSCEEPFANCNTSDPDGGYMDGCETNTDTDPANCGACGRVCPAVNGTATCMNGTCGVSCNVGFADCTGGVADGCETNTTNNKANCGGCGSNCDNALASRHATGKCVSSQCQRDQCLANWGDCDTDPSACESNLLTDVGDCGACNRACVPTGTSSQGNECLSGTCTPHCDTTHANCDTMGPNGCEINTSTDNANCGSCNNACASGRMCSGSSCVCTGGLTLCGGSCVNTTNDNAHCGNCTTTCTGGQSCVTSVCRCPAGQTFCNGLCVNMQTDGMNCGMCGRACQTPTGTTSNTCMSGACVPVCGTLRDSCDMEPWDGCEENLASNNANCGACGRACQTGTGSPTFVSANTCSTGGVCQATCVAGHADCNSAPWDGCEADITTVTQCGACTNADCAGTVCGTTGDTSCCVATGGGASAQYRCQAAITIALDVDASIAGATLSFTHALQPGTNRLILLAVAAEVGGGSVTASKPDVVTYGGTAMTPGTEQSGGTGFWSPDLFFYYLTESGIGNKTGNQTVVVDGAPASPNPGSPSVIIANLVQLGGVKQSNPLGPYTGGVLPTDGDADHISQILPVTTTGSRIYTLTAGMFCGGSALTPYLTGGTAPDIRLNNTGVSGSGVDMRAAGAYAGSGGPNSLAGGPSTTYEVGWDYAFCGEITHEAVVVSPAP